MAQVGISDTRQVIILYRVMTVYHRNSVQVLVLGKNPDETAEELRFTGERTLI